VVVGTYGGKDDSLLHGKEIQLAFRAAMSIIALTKNYKTLVKRTSPKRREGWKKEPEGILIINVDAPFGLILE
jgi:hypothetical protein